MIKFMIATVFLIIGWSPIAAKIVVEHDEFDHTTIIRDDRTDQTRQFCSLVLITHISEQHTAQFAGLLVWFSYNGSLKDVREGDKIKFIINDDGENVISLPILSTSDNEIGDRHMEKKLIQLDRTLFQRFGNARSIRCKVGNVARYKFTSADIQGFKDAWLEYKMITTED